MADQGYRRRGRPIGMAMTEAACKTVFTQRSKDSGMRWHGETGQMTPVLRRIQLSSKRNQAVAAYLAARQSPLRVACRAARQGSHQQGEGATQGGAASFKDAGTTTLRESLST
jgi:hypothetical protein